MEAPGVQIAIPILGIVAAAAVTFYAVSFAELREKSLRDLENEDGGAEEGFKFKSSPSSRQRRAKRKANKQQN